MIDEYVSLSTDPENQPHQFVGKEAEVLAMVKPSKAYIVAKVGYEYNDEGYSPAGNYGTLYEDMSEVYSDRNVAVQKQIDNTTQVVREVAGDHYGLATYAYEEIEIGGVYKESLEDIFGEDYAEDNEWRMFIPADATDEQIEAVAKLLGSVFFEIIEIEIQ